MGRACDDGNIDNGDECTSECILASCGDGIVDREEECDDGMGNSDTLPNACRINCTRARCGDDVQDAGEQCDDGAENGAVCTYGEMSCEVCSDTCRNVMGATSFCGDNQLDAMAGEQCDDGNQVTEVCPYSQMSCVVCNATCQETAGAVAYCGDGTEDGAARTGGMAEVCDDGADNGNDRLCKSDCTPAVCGDGHHLTEVTTATNSKFEYCDDGNEFDMNDGCNRDCELTESRENLDPPRCDRNQTGECYVGVGTEQDGGGCVRLDGDTFETCLYKNPLPLLSSNAQGNRRQGRIHGVLTYNANERLDTDVFRFEQLCGYQSIVEDRGNDCSGANTASYRFIVDYDQGVGTNNPFYVNHDCNGGFNPNGPLSFCPEPSIASFCDGENDDSLCSNKPAGKERAYWCTTAGTVGEYRIWLQSQTEDSIDYTLTVKEFIGEDDCP